MKKYKKSDQRRLAAWAANCAERVLPCFEKAYPADDRPRAAIEACRAWVRTGIFSMAVIRAASLSAHAAARRARDDGHPAACFAARAAGQAVGTAHVAQHAYGAALYALKTVAAAGPEGASTGVAREHAWQARHIAPNLKREFFKRVVVQERKGRVFPTIRKDERF